jgi:hypothetical protein
MRFNVKALAITSGILWGLGLFCITWWVIFFEGSEGGPTALAHVYRGYSMTPLGSVIGLAWGLADGLIGGAIFAWVYNYIAGCVEKKA